MNTKRVRLLNRRAAVWIRTTSIVLAVTLLTVAMANAGPWSHARGDAANTGLADVITAPASLPTRKVTGIGSYAPGAGPVVAADGTVYLGSIQGLLRAFTPAGDPK